MIDVSHRLSTERFKVVPADVVPRHALRGHGHRDRARERLLEGVDDRQHVLEQHTAGRGLQHATDPKASSETRDDDVAAAITRTRPRAEISHLSTV